MDELKLTALDRKLIRRLQYDGRLSYSTLAEELGVPPGTVRYRIHRLLDRGVMQVVGIVDPQLLGWEAAAMVGVTVESEEVDAVAQQISQFPEVSYLVMVSGTFDLVVEVFCRDTDHLVAFLNEKLRRIRGVERTETFMILKMYKLSYRWGEAAPSPRALRLDLASRRAESGGADG